MANSPLFKYRLIHDGKTIAIEVADRIPKFMNRMKRRGGCQISIDTATEEEIRKYFKGDR